MREKTKILTVFDSGGLAKSVRSVLGARNCTVATVDTAKGARQRIEKTMPDVLLVCLDARRKSRYATCRSLAKSFPFLPIVIVADTLETAIQAEEECPGMGYYMARDRISAGLFRRIEREANFQRALRAERDFNAAILDSTAALIMVLTPKGEIEKANRAFQDVLGYRPDRLVGKSVRSLAADPKSAAALGNLHKKSPKGAPVRREDAALRGKSGKTVYVSWSGVAVYEPNGRVRHFICTGANVTPWKLAEEELKQSERRFSRVFHASPAVFAFTRMSDGYHYDVNERWLSVLGYRPKEVIGKTARELNVWVDMNDRKRLAAALKKKSAVRGFETQLRTKKGEARDFQIAAERVQMDGEDRILFLANDVTDIKRADAELVRSHATERMIAGITRAFLEKKLDTAIRFSLSQLGTALGVDMVGVYRFDVEPNMMVNTHAWSPEAKTKMPLMDLSCDTFVYCVTRFDAGETSIARRLSDLPKWADKERRALKKQGVRSMINVPLMVRSEAIGCLSVDSVRSERDWRPEEVRLVRSAAEAIALGILARETEAELEQTLKGMARTVEVQTRELRENEERLRDMTEASSDWRWEMDEDLRFIRFSETAKRILGFDPQNIIGKRREDLILASKHGGDLSAWKSMEKHLEDLHAHKSFRDFQYPFQLPDGEVRHIRISGKPVFDDSGTFTGYRGTGTDVTREVLAAREAARAQVQLVEAIESIDGGMILIDKDMTFVLCNTRYREEYAALDDLLRPGADYAEIVRASVERGVVDTGGVPVEDWVAYRLSRPEGLKRASEQRLVDGRWGLVNDYVTREGGRLIVRTDITPRKEAEEALRASEERRRLVLETVLDGIITIDRRGIVQSMNPAAEKLFNYDADEVIGQNVSMLMPEPYKSQHDSYLEQYIRTGDAKIIGIGREVEGQRKDGSVFPLDLAVSETEIGGEPVFVGVIRDISERKKFEEEILRARFEAEASNRAKSQFLANMSHELRTPLNAILGFSETISSEIFGPMVNERYSEYISNIQNSGQHLLTLINDILDLSKIEAGAFELSEEDVNVADMIQACMAFVSSQAHDRGVLIRTNIEEGLADYRLDPRRMKQVVLNLISNALKYGYDHGAVEVSAFADTDGTLVIEVRDDGVGMDADEIILALSEFGQVQSVREHSHAHEGTGLGLPLSNNLVAVHGGTLSIESEKGKGTRVIVRLPASRRLS